MAFMAGSIVGKAFLDTKAWTAGMTKINSSVVQAKGSMAKLSGAFKIAGVAAAAFLGASAVKANEFNKEFANVSTLVDTSTVSMENMKKELLGLDSRLGSSIDLTKGLYQALSASVEPAKAVEFVGEAAKFAKAALVDTNTAVDVITTGLNAYGMAADEATRVSDIFFQTIKYGKVTGEELSATIGQSIPLAANMGVKLEELGASMAIMTRQGVKAANATTQINGVLRGFLKPSVQMQEALQKIGVESGQAAIEQFGMVGALKKVIATTDGTQDSIAKLFRNIRGLRGVLALTGAGASDFDEILKEMYNSSGSTTEAFEKQELTFDTLANTTEKLMIKIGDELLPTLYELASGATDLIDWFSNLDDGTKELIGTVAKLAGGIGIAVLVVPKLIAAFTALNAVIATNPFGAAVIAIAALTTAVVAYGQATKQSMNYGKSFNEFMDEQTAKVKDAAGGFDDLITKIDEFSKATGGAGVRGFGQDIEETRQVLSESKDKVKELKKEIADLERSMKGGKETTGYYSGGFINLNNSANNAAESISDITKETEQLAKKKNELDMYTEAVERYEAHLRTLEDTTMGVGEKTDGATFKLRDYVSEMENLKQSVFDTIPISVQMYADYDKVREDSHQRELKRLEDEEIAHAQFTSTWIEDTKKYTELTISSMTSIGIGIAKGIQEGKDAWEIFKDAAKEAIATVLDALAQQFTINAVAAGLELNFIAAAGWGALAIAAGIAAGAVRGLEQGGFATPGMAIVGEAGPELINIGKTSTITPAMETDRLLRKKSVTMNNTFIISGDTDAELVTRKLGRRLANAERSL